MSSLLLVASLVVCVVAVAPLADRLRLPAPVLLTVLGLALPGVPGMPPLTIDPDLVLPVVLPPLLFAATQRASARQFRDEARPILLLAVGLTVVTAAAAAVVGHALGLGWGAAWVLGAVVAPPDPVAATAVARQLRLPHRLVTVLEGEGMFNDATALVLYQVTVAAVVTGGVGPGEVVARLLLAVLIGVVIGVAAGWLTRAVLALLHDAAAETTVTLAVPFAAYLLAEHVHGSGVLAVLSLGLYLRSYAHPAITSGGWLLGRAVWRYGDFLITSVVFLLIGFELTTVLTDSPVTADTVRLATVTVATLVVVRFGWLFPAVAIARLRRDRAEPAAPAGGRETLVAAWAGMRGVVTVATALALPTLTDRGSAFPNRTQLLVVALVVVLVTLVVQGLTLAPLVRALDVGVDSDIGRETAQLRRRAAQAALNTVTAHGAEVPSPVRHAATLQYEGYLAAQEALQSARETRHRTDESSHDGSSALTRVLEQAADAERAVVLHARATGETSAEAADIVLSDVEARALRDFR